MEFIDLTEDKLEWFLSIRNEAAQEGYLHDERQFSLQEAQAWFKQLPPSKRYYIIRSGTEDIGYFRTNSLRPSVGGGRGMDVGADLHKAFRGQGLAYEAYKEFFTKLVQDGTDFVTLQVLSSNQRAIQLYFKLGFYLLPSAETVTIKGRLIPNLHMKKVLIYK